MSRKVCVVTGSSRGAGAATAVRFAQAGYDVVVNCTRDMEGAQATAASCREHGATALIVQANVASDEECRSFAARVEAEFGRADVLVNNAGTTKFANQKNLDLLDAADFHAIYDVNVVGPYQMTRAFLPLLRANPPGAVVNVSSIASFMGTGSSLAYMASKGALNALTAGLARSLGPQVRVNAIAPGFIEGEWLKQGHGEERYNALRDAWRSRAALAETIRPEDVAAMAFWLGDGATRTTGEVLVLDGGFRLGRA
ncbi:MAG: SDR family oxidoreductase [Burkholderiaceae bacterium]|nr:SDR family oxidoreductase [Burkholderiaceae bacterium]